MNCHTPEERLLPAQGVLSYHESMKELTQDIIDRAFDEFQALSNSVHLVGRSEHKGKDSILVLVDCRLSQLKGIIPEQYEGFPVMVEQADKAHIQ